MTLDDQSFRPAAMLIERSSDYGKTWKVYRYFAYDCKGSFPDIPNQRPTTHSEVICTEKYSNVAPSTGGEVTIGARKCLKDTRLNPGGTACTVAAHCP